MMRAWLFFIFGLCILGACQQPGGTQVAADKNDTMESFKTVAWAGATNIYEVNLRQYTAAGTFKAFEAELPRLQDMGVEVLWFMPITPISVKNRKGSLGSYYAASSYDQTNPEYGSLDDFKQLVQSAHQQGFKVIIDWVANHTGWDHVWTKEHPDFYVRDQNGQFTEKNGWDDVIDLNYQNPAMRKAMIEAMRFWVKETGIDGFRCDMAMLVPLEFWKEVRFQLDQERPLFWLAECEEANYHEVFDATYSWKWMHKTADFYKGHTNMAGLDSVLQAYHDDFPAQAIRTYFTSNHDENSWNGTEYEKYGAAAKALAVFSCTWNGVPLIYSGQEMPNLKRLKFFDKDPIEWNGQYALHDFYKTLLNLHKQHPALRAGDSTVVTYRLQTDAPDQIMAYLRKRGDEEVLVLLNLSAQNQLRFELTDKAVHGLFTNAFGGVVNDFTQDRRFEMGAWDYLVYVKKNAATP
jgi:alpha-amylase